MSLIVQTPFTSKLLAVIKDVVRLEAPKHSKVVPALSVRFERLAEAAIEFVTPKMAFVQTATLLPPKKMGVTISSPALTIVPPL